MAGAHEIKGSAFVTLARWTLAERGKLALDALVEALPFSDRDALTNPTASAWYPEEVHQRVLRGVWVVLAQKDPREYEQIIAKATELGVRSFARLILSFASPSFVLRRAPTLWSMLRRGPATLTIHQHGPMTELHYRDFPFFGDELYRRYFHALLGALVRPSLGRAPPVTIVGFGDDHLDVRITLALERHAQHAREK